MDNLQGNKPEESGSNSASRWSEIWESISRAGLAELSIRLGTHVLLVALILVVAWGLREFYFSAQLIDATTEGALAAAPVASPTAIQPVPVLPKFPSDLIAAGGVSRSTYLHTNVPSRSRTDVILYTVQNGDTLFGIADKFSLRPETILWANQGVLGDNPHNLRPGQELNILPVNGTYYRWSVGDGLNGVANFFGVSPEDILSYPGNNLDITTIGDWSNPDIEAGTWLIVPGGQREYVSWSAPAIPREDPSVARVLGPGVCEAVSGGAVGSGTFIWPANKHTVSGFDYNPSANHSGIDVDGSAGDPVYATDNGVVVYAGWNNWGYGNVVVLNHGNGWQTLYAHLSDLYVGCGQSVFQGSSIGAFGSTGNATGPHLHFEMMYNGTKVNPWDYLP